MDCMVDWWTGGLCGGLAGGEPAKAGGRGEVAQAVQGRRRLLARGPARAGSRAGLASGGSVGAARLR
eukprot:15284-Prorocentrum_minimum.AAC.1